MNLEIIDLGLVDFNEAWARQKDIFNEVKDARLRHALLICRHNPVITLGRNAKKTNILASGEELKNKGIVIYEVERGGDVTYHGPGQLIVYPIFNLNYLKKDINWFLRYLEGLILSCLSDFGVAASRKSGLTGVWIGNKKIASIGISVKNWITMHGLSINIKSNDLANFSLIKPCGMDIMMTSIETESGKDISIELAKTYFINSLSKRLSL